MKKIKSDMPGDVVEIGPDQKEKAENIFSKLFAELKENIENKDKIVVSLYGGSGSGKSSFAVLLAQMFGEKGIGYYVISGDNYPRRIPVENDMMRQKIYDESGVDGLRRYLCGPDEIDYDTINNILEQFKSGKDILSLKRMGTKKEDIWFEDVDVSDISIIILEWTHGNNENLKNIDYPIYLHSTPELTYQRRVKRNRNANAGSDFISLVLKLEQEKLLGQVAGAKMIVDIDGSIISYKEYVEKYEDFDIRPMLNVYPDSINGNVSGLIEFIKSYTSGAFSSIYMLPSVFHSDLDRGFSIIDYDLEGTMASKEDIRELSNMGLTLKMDFVMNHLSVNSPQFKDILENGENSEYKDFFINWNLFWDGYGQLNEDGVLIPDKKYTDKMFFRKPGLPILMVRMPDGKKVPYWNTFYQKVECDSDGNERYLGQMDLNIKSELVWDYYREVLKKLALYGVKIVRLDAFAYAPKEPGEKNFLNEPGTWELLSKVSEEAKVYDLKLLPEIHAGYNEKIYEKIAKKGYITYDFFMPGLIIDAIENKNGDTLVRWGKEVIEKNISTVNMLGCHDGIPLLDLKGLIPEERIQGLIDTIVNRGGYIKNLHGQKNIYYQVNSTFYSALGEDDKKLLVARALQLFMPGKPQIWYLDLFAGKNDHEAVRKAGKDGHKEINRTNLDTAYILENADRDVVKRQIEMIAFRNTCSVFKKAARIEFTSYDTILKIKWSYKSESAELTVDFEKMEYTINEKLS